MRGKKIQCSALFALTMAMLVCCGHWALLLAAGLAAAIHEGGHLLAIFLCGGRAESFVLGLGGAEIRYHCPRADYYREGMIALAGPAANLTTCGLAALLSRMAPAGPWQEGLYLFCGCNALLALFNLIPAAPLDGGVTLRCLLLRHLELDRAEALAAAFSLASGLALLAAGVLLCCKTRGNITLLACALAILGRQGRNFFTPGRKSLIV